jgi:hypothetical protein
MSTKLEIQISPELLASLGKSMYANGFFMTIIRELIQNSLDADSKNIDVLYRDNRLTVIDNGYGIKQVDGLLNVIGGAYHESTNSIGGFGLAKIAIFACDYWQFKSVSGSFCKGFNYDENDTLDNGTIVFCDFLSKDIPWNVEKKITSFLSMINRDVIFTFNDQVIEKSQFGAWEVDGKFESMADNYLYNGHIVIRLNGMPTFQTYVNTLEKSVIFDYFTDLNPYDDNYPLVTNRDAFKESTQEFIDFKSRKQSLEDKLHSDKQLAELSMFSISSVNFQGGKFKSSGDVSVKDYKQSSRVIYTYKRYMLQIASLFKVDSDNFTFGLCDGSQGEDGAYIESENLFTISKYIDNDDKGKILAIAMHEFCHFNGYTYHNEDFMSELYRVNSKVIDSLFSGEFRK